MKKMFLCVFTIVVSTNSIADCDMKANFNHKIKVNKKNKIVKILEDKNAVLFKSHMHVNTDGAPNSYHPDDLWGSEKALNTICNGVNLKYDFKKYNYKNCKNLIEKFKLIRDTNYESKKGNIHFYGIATKKNQKPCIIKEGKYKGFYVSTTSLQNTEKDVCDQKRYLNSLEIPFIIYPNSRNFKKRKIGNQNLALYYNPKTGVKQFAIVADRGPSWGLAEGSIYMAKKLNQYNHDPKNRKDTYKFGVSNIRGLIFKGNIKLEPPYTVERIEEAGRKALENWGGESRLQECFATLD